MNTPNTQISKSFATRTEAVEWIAQNIHNSLQFAVAYEEMKMYRIYHPGESIKVILPDADAEIVPLD